MKARRKWLVIFCCALVLVALRFTHYMYKRAILRLYRPEQLLCTSWDSHQPPATSLRWDLLHKLLTERSLVHSTLFSWYIDGELLDPALASHLLIISPLEMASSHMQSSSWVSIHTLLLSWAWTITDDEPYASGTFQIGADIVYSWSDLYVSLKNISLIPWSTTVSSLISGWYTILRIWSSRWIHIPYDMIDSTWFLVSFREIFCAWLQEEWTTSSLRHTILSHPTPSLSTIALQYQDPPLFAFSGIQQISLPWRYPQGELRGKISHRNAMFEQHTQRSFAPAMSLPDIVYALDIQDILRSIKKQPVEAVEEVWSTWSAIGNGWTGTGNENWTE